MTANEFGAHGRASAEPDGGVWLRPASSRPRRGPPLSTERIVEAAVVLLDSDGAAQLTMRRLAARLQVTATALYWHVRTRDDVLDLALDHVFGTVAIPEPTADWRADATTLIRRWRAAMVEHPWTPGLIGRPMLGPNVLARTEFLQDSLSRGGLSGLDLEVATHALANYVIGAAATAVAWRTVDSSRGQDGLRELRARHPDLHGGHLGPDRDDDTVFERGLAVVLDGVEPLRRSGDLPSSPTVRGGRD